MLILLRKLNDLIIYKFIKGHILKTKLTIIIIDKLLFPNKHTFKCVRKRN